MHAIQLILDTVAEFRNIGPNGTQVYRALLRDVMHDYSRRECCLGLPCPVQLRAIPGIFAEEAQLQAVADRGHRGHRLYAGTLRLR